MYGVVIASAGCTESKKNCDLITGSEDKNACRAEIDEFDMLRVLSTTRMEPSDIATTGTDINGATALAIIQSQSIAFRSFDLK